MVFRGRGFFFSLEREEVVGLEFRFVFFFWKKFLVFGFSFI